MIKSMHRAIFLAAAITACTACSAIAEDKLFYGDLFCKESMQELRRIKHSLKEFEIKHFNLFSVSLGLSGVKLQQMMRKNRYQVAKAYPKLVQRLFLYEEYRSEIAKIKFAYGDLEYMEEPSNGASRIEIGERDEDKIARRLRVQLCELTGRQLIEEIDCDFGISWER